MAKAFILLVCAVLSAMIAATAIVVDRVDKNTLYTKTLVESAMITSCTGP